MQKEFDDWNIIKKNTDAEEVGIERFFHYRDVWWCKFGKNIGFEEDGKGKDFLRPILVLRVLGKNTLLVVPLTTSSEEHFFRVDVGIVDGKPAKAIISQIRVIDARRLQERIDRIDYKYMNILKKAIKGLF